MITLFSSQWVIQYTRRMNGLDGADIVRSEYRRLMVKLSVPVMLYIPRLFIIMSYRM